jgi:hypothetical protein
MGYTNGDIDSGETWVLMVILSLNTWRSTDGDIKSGEKWLLLVIFSREKQGY